jgi:UDP-glucose 4-epimerase
LITGVSRFLGLRLAKRLAEEGVADALIGVDLEEPHERVYGLEFVRVDIRSPLIARVIEATRVDTIVHTNIGSSLTRFGGRAAMKENNVIGTMQLLAAAQRAARVAKVIMKSSAAIYGSHPGEPSLVPEDHAGSQVRLSGYGKDCAEAEAYARDFGRRRPDVQLVVLRTQQVIGPTVRTGMTGYLSLPVVPTALGYDPRLQLLHEDDAVEAFLRTVTEDCRGIFNVAADGCVYLSQAIRMLGRVPLPLPLPAALIGAEALRRSGVIDFAPDQLAVLLYGRVLDTRRAKQGFGFAPTYTTAEALEDYRDRRTEVPEPEPRPHPTWERELFEYLKRRAALREGV